jgi:hypothetical protein
MGSDLNSIAHRLRQHQRRQAAKKRCPADHNKVIYERQTDAEHALLTFLLHPHPERRTQNRVYRCDTKKHYHLTSQGATTFWQPTVVEVSPATAEEVPLCGVEVRTLDGSEVIFTCGREKGHVAKMHKDGNREWPARKGG